MYARNLSIHLKPTSLQAYNEKLEREVMPLLRMQEGFRNVVTYSDGDGAHVTAISLWDTEAHADKYSSTGYHQVMKVLEPVINYTETAERGNCTVLV